MAISSAYDLKNIIKKIVEPIFGIEDLWVYNKLASLAIPRIEEKDGQTRVLRSVSAKAVACLALITLIKDCYKILKSHGKQNFFSHCRDLLVH